MISITHPFGFAQGRLFSQSERKRVGHPGSLQIAAAVGQRWGSLRRAGALRPGRVAERWDKFPGSRFWLLSSAIRSRPLPLLRAWVKGSGQECPLYTNQSSGRSTNPRSFTGRMPWHCAGSVGCVGVPSASLRAGSSTT